MQFQNVVAHELLHLLGVGHEQQRPDRDRYIAVNWTNIHIDHAFNFFKVRKETTVVFPIFFFNITVSTHLFSM